MSDNPDANPFPWEEPGGSAAQSGSDPYDPNRAAPPPADVSPDDAAEHVHREDFHDPEVHTADSPDAARAQERGTAPARRGEQHGHGRPLVRKEYYSISEVSDLVGLPAHVLRYWESQFSVLNPSKNRSGNRVYQRKEIRLILLVKQLLYEDKYTVEGAKQRLDQLRRGGELQDATTRVLDEQLLTGLRDELRTLAELLRPDAG